jgi:hypothetical protein
MRKRYVVSAIAIAAGLIAGASVAATLGNGNGQTCTGIGTWHFVNNQTGGAAQGQLTASWSTGDTCTVGAYSVLTKTQHFLCSAAGTLVGATTNLPGRLVLSDFSCAEPPKCDKNCEPEPPK